MIPVGVSEIFPPQRVTGFHVDAKDSRSAETD